MHIKKVWQNLYKSCIRRHAFLLNRLDRWCSGRLSLSNQTAGVLWSVQPWLLSKYLIQVQVQYSNSVTEGEMKWVHIMSSMTLRCSHWPEQSCFVIQEKKNLLNFTLRELKMSRQLCILENKTVILRRWFL